MSALKTKNIIASIAQLLLAVILLPFVCIILHLILPESGVSLLLNTISECPFVGEILGVISELLVKLQQGQDISMVEFIDKLNGLISASVFEAVLIGMCIEMCHTLGEMIGIRGIPVLQTLVGIVLGIIVTNNSNALNLIYNMLFLMVVNIVLILFTVSGQISKKILEIFLGITIQSYIAGFASGYATVLAYIMSGGIDKVDIAIILILITLLPVIVFLSLDYILIKPKTSKK